MVEFHKGFDGFENLRPRKEKEAKKASISKDDDIPSLREPISNIPEAEVIYKSLLEFVHSVLDMVEAGDEDKLKANLIITKVKDYAGFFIKDVNLNDIVRLVFQHDEFQPNYIYSHSVNVCLLCVRIALDLNFPEKKLRDLISASLFHDVGLMRIPEKLWNKPGKLSSGEYKEAQKHVVYGAEILGKLSHVLGDAIPEIVSQYHEHVNGTGYPSHLTKDEIRYEARLLSLVDKYESMTHTRLWRPRILPDKAIQSILDNESSTFDSHFLRSLLKCISIFPVGIWVRLSTGECGEVLSTNPNTPMRPIVNVFVDREKKRLKASRVLDLSKQLLIHIERCVEPEKI